MNWNRVLVAFGLLLGLATWGAAQGINNPQTNASALTSGTVACGRMPALTGVVTSSAGSCATAGTVTSAFSVHNNGVDETGIGSAAFTQVTFSTEVYDVGNNFASSTWTPPAGKVNTSAGTVIFGTATLGATAGIAFYKNGTIYKQVALSVNAAGVAGGGIAIDDIANGTDAYTLRATITLTGGTATVQGLAISTWWMGHWIGP